jgi:hypothetical protein
MSLNVQMLHKEQTHFNNPVKVCDSGKSLYKYYIRHCSLSWVYLKKHHVSEVGCISILGCEVKQRPYLRTEVDPASKMLNLFKYPWDDWQCPTKYLYIQHVTNYFERINHKLSQLHVQTQPRFTVGLDKFPQSQNRVHLLPLLTEWHVKVYFHNI